MSRGKNKQSMDHTPKLPILTLLDQQISLALQANNLPSTDSNVRPDLNLRYADYVSPIALKLAKMQGVSPLKIAETLSKTLTKSPLLKGVKISVTPPGYLNFELESIQWQKTLQLLSNDQTKLLAPNPQNILLELVSANPTGLLTVGSARNAIWGDTLGHILAANGHNITREYYVNDAGNQVQTYAKSLQAHALNLPIPEDGYKGEDAKAIAKAVHKKYGFNISTPLSEWQAAGIEYTLETIKADLKLLDVNIDQFKSETSLHQTCAVESVLKKLTPHLYEKDGATYLSTSKWGDDKDRVVVRANHEPTYFAVDIAYLEDKFNRQYDRLVYILGVDHSGYVTRMKAAACALGYDPDKVDIKLYELVTIKGSRGGKRLGNIPSVQQTLQATSSDALKWYLLASSAEQTINLDLEQMAAKTMDNPVYYVQYAHARTCSLLEKAKTQQLKLSKELPMPTSLTDPERKLAILLALTPNVLANAANETSPHQLPTHLLELARAYNNFYTKFPVLNEADTNKQQWLLSMHSLTGKMIEQGLSLMGISAPTKM